MKKLLLGLAMGGLLMTALPAVADHPEPDRPIVGLYVYLYKYTDRSNTQLSAEQCADGSVTLGPDVKTLRVEPYVVVPVYPGDSRATPTPSEHFVLTSQRKAPFDTFTQGGNPTRKTLGIGGNSWKHQNIPPHARMTSRVKFDASVPFAGELPVPGEFSAWEADQASFVLRHYGEGLFSQTYVVTGMESGNRFEVSCKFRWSPETP